MRRDTLIVLCLLSAVGVLAQERIVERVPTPFNENGQPVTLELVIFKPAGAGPFPTLVFNHGSTGRGNDPSLFTRTWASPAIAQFFNDKGWLVAFPQRRGRGQSGGIYDEGFEPDRSRYTCSPQVTLAGFERALKDIGSAVDFIQRRPDVDRNRMLIGGQSRGGALSIAYAGTSGHRFLGVINFVGGWVGEGCKDADLINSTAFKRGGRFDRQTLWLYGQNDAFYSVPHSRRNFEAFMAAGGKGVFHEFSLGEGINGHFLLSKPELWSETVSTFIGSAVATPP